MSTALVPIAPEAIAKWGAAFGEDVERDAAIAKALSRVEDSAGGAPVITNQLEADLALDRLKDLRLGERALDAVEKKCDLLRIAKMLTDAVKSQTRPRRDKIVGAFVGWKRALDGWDTMQMRIKEAADRKAREDAAAAVAKARAEEADDDIPELTAVQSDVPAPPKVQRLHENDPGGTARWKTTTLKCELVDVEAAAAGAPNLLRLDESAAKAAYRDLVKRVGEEGVADMGKPGQPDGVVVCGVRYWFESGSSFRA